MRNLNWWLSLVRLSEPNCSHWSAPDRYQNLSGIEWNTSPIRESPLRRSTRRSFAPSQKSRRNNRYFVWTEALPDIIFVRAQKLPDISPKVRESGFRNPGFLESRIQLKESGIPQSIGIQSPSSTDRDWNPVTWNPEFTVWNPESHNRLESRIQVLLTNTGIQLPGIWNLQREIQNPRLPWIPFHGAGHRVNINLVNQHGRHSVTWKRSIKIGLNTHYGLNS